jgi:2-haloacid dehalogenase
MAAGWVLFDLNGTLVDPGVLAQPLGDSASAEDLVYAALDVAVAQAMAVTLTGERADFRTLLDGALRRGLALAGQDPALAADAIELMGSMPAFLEAPAALERLRGEGMHLGVLTQSTTEAAEQVLRFAGLRDRMDLVIGADESGAFKPDAPSYHAAVGRTGAEPRDVWLVSAHWWDVMGASRAGLRTAWVARRERVLLASVPDPDVQGSDLLEVADGILTRLSG